jgi:DNA-directed RNA polymerase subunit beta'
VPLLSGLQEVLYAKADGALKVHDLGRVPNPDSVARPCSVTPSARRFARPSGRVIFNQIWPGGLGFVNFPVPKSKLGDLILNTYKISGNQITVETLDKLKELGFQTAFQAGISIGIDDMIIPTRRRRSWPIRARRSPKSKASSTRASSPTASATTRSSTSGPAPPTRSRRKFRQAREQRWQDRGNPVYIMMDSGARGNKQQVASCAAPAA